MPQKVYDDKADDERSPLGRLRKPAGDPSDPRSEYDPQTSPKVDPSDPRSELEDGETNKGIYNPDGDKTDSQSPEDLENGEQDSGLYRRGADNKPKRFNLRGRFSKRQKVGGAIFGTGAIAGIIFFGASQGPLQFVHFAQLMQKFHFSRNEDFGNDRTAKVLIYGLAGKGAQNGRLGVLGNAAANKWEKKLLREHGLKPVYQEPNRRFVGFEIVHDTKAQRIIGDVGDVKGRDSKRVENSMGKGAEVRTAGEAGGSNGSNNTLVSGNGEKLDNKSRFLDLSQVNFADRRAWVRTIGQATGTNRIASSMASRLLITRFGVNFHPMNKVKDRTDSGLANRQDRKAVAEEIKQDRAENITDGVESTPGLAAATNKEGKTDPADVEAEEETKSYIEDFKNSGTFKTAGNATIVVGVLCAAKQFGNAVPEYKYVNNVLPMTRMGMNSVTTGNQVMTGTDFDAETLSSLSEYFDDEEAGTNWREAESVRAELGKKGGKPMPPEADLKNVGEKPELFNVIDSIGPLSAACSIVEGISGLPIISNISSVVGDVTGALVNLPLGAVGTSTDELMESALKAVSGTSVNPESKGADFGNLANTGSFLAGNDNALSMGGAPLSPEQVAELDSLERYYEGVDNSQRSIAKRLFDIKDVDSVAGNIAMAMPSSGSQAAVMIQQPLSSFSSLLGSLLPKASANRLPYDYGTKMVGFSVEEMSNEAFENPYENAAIVEPQLAALNEAYGKCFGLNVTEEGIQSSEMGSEELNMFKRDAKCDPANNPDPMYQRFRFYIADLVTSTSMACRDGDDDACSQIGIGDGALDSGGDDSGSGAAVNGSAEELAKELIDSGKISGAPEYIAQIEAYAKGDTSCHVNIHILKMLVGMVRDGHSIEISSLNRFCTGVLTASGEASYHYSDEGGHAIDITSFDGSATTGGDGASLDYIKEALKYIPSGSGIGQNNCRSSPLDLPSGITEFYDSCNHVHIQVAKDT